MQYFAYKDSKPKSILYLSIINNLRIIPDSWENNYHFPLLNIYHFSLPISAAENPQNHKSGRYIFSTLFVRSLSGSTWSGSIVTDTTATLLSKPKV
jgi:hypothetical protein